MKRSGLRRANQSGTTNDSRGFSSSGNTATRSKTSSVVFSGRCREHNGRQGFSPGKRSRYHPPIGVFARAFLRCFAAPEPGLPEIGPAGLNPNSSTTHIVSGTAPADGESPQSPSNCPVTAPVSLRERLALGRRVRVWGRKSNGFSARRKPRPPKGHFTHRLKFRWTG
jgi:hypothetical protein